MLFFQLSVWAQTDVKEFVLSDSTNAGSHTDYQWNFASGEQTFAVTSDQAGGYGNNGDLVKWNQGHTYTVPVPGGWAVTEVTFTGRSNFDEVATLAKFNGEELDNTDGKYTLGAVGDDSNNKTVTISGMFLRDKFSFTMDGTQVLAIVTFKVKRINFEETMDYSVFDFQKVANAVFNNVYSLDTYRNSSDFIKYFGTQFASSADVRLRTDKSDQCYLYNFKSGSRDVNVYNLRKGEKFKINGNITDGNQTTFKSTNVKKVDGGQVAVGEVLVLGEEYEMLSDGTLALSMGRNSKWTEFVKTSYKWDFTQGWTTTASNIRYGNNEITGFNGWVDSKMDAVKINYTSPTDSKIPEFDGLLLNGAFRVKPNEYFNAENGGELYVPVVRGQVVSLYAVSGGTTTNGGAARTHFDFVSVDTAYVDVANSTVSNSVASFDETKFVYTAQADGYVKIKKTTDAVLLNIRRIFVSDAPIAFSEDGVTANLLDFELKDRPTLSLPTGATVTYSSSNPKILAVDGATGAVRFVKDGLASVNAEVVYEGNTYRVQYTVTVDVANAKYSYDEDTNTYTLTGEGKLGDRSVTDVKPMTVEFGASKLPSSTVVEDIDGMYVASTIDSNGWRQLWENLATDGSVVPYQGTFYAFRPAADGKLWFKGIPTGNNYTVFADSADYYNPIEIIRGEDCTGKVGTANDAWIESTGVAAVGYAPAVTTAAGETVQMVERYETTAETTGEILVQEVTDLENGLYNVVLYANAFFTPGRGFESTMADGATDVAYVFAGDKQVAVKAAISGATSVNGEYTISGVYVSDGTLRIGLGKSQAGTNWHTIQIKSLSRSEVAIERTYDLQAGHVYYLYGCHSNMERSLEGGGWGVFKLNSFSYESTAHFDVQSVVLRNGETEYTQAVHGGSGNVTYSVECEGDLTGASVDANGKVSGWSGNGGAMVVTAKDNINGNSMFYTITVPYAEMDWDFEADDKVEFNTEHLPKENRDWGLVYKVRQYEQNAELGKRVLTYINDPVLSPAAALVGNNAAYISETAGLVVEGTGKSFGVRVGTQSLVADGMTAEEKHNALVSQLGYGYDDATSCGILSMNRDAKLTIPNLKAGQYVSIRWYRHAAGMGDAVKVTNLTDLNGQDIPDSILVVTQNNHMKYGWIGFKVKADGDVTLQVADNGWVNIRRIKVGAQPESHLRLVMAGHTAGTSYIHRGNGTTITYENTNNQHQELGHVIKFSLKDVAPAASVAARSVSGLSITEAGVLTIGAGFSGTATVVQEAVNVGKYVLEKKETAISVTINQDGIPAAQTYPYTWNFTDISDATNEALATEVANSTNEWTGDATNGFTPAFENVYKDGTQIQFNKDGAVVPELEGLGFVQDSNTETNDNANALSNMTVKDGEGLVINGTTNIVLPAVPADTRVYVRAEVNDGGSVKANGETLSIRYNGADSDASNDVYMTQGNGSDIVLSITNATVQGIGATNIFKSCHFLDKYNAIDSDHSGEWYYNTDCQPYEINYSLTELYTGQPMEAMIVTNRELPAENAERYDEGHLTIKKVNIPASETGLIVCSTIDKKLPLFTRSVNEVASEDESMLIGVIADTEVQGSDFSANRYAFTNDYKDQGVATTADAPAFYKVNEAGTLAANHAYFEFALTDGASLAEIKAFRITPWDDEATGIEKVKADDAIDMDGTFYTLTGVRIEGKPAQRGVYIQNGKKVYIK